eukprot:COSAG02_NODE_39003_length_422_cov_0.795666_1_plen_72_part_01
MISSFYVLRTIPTQPVLAVMVTAAEKREEGNELFRAGQHRAAAAAYGEAIGRVAHEVGALAMAAGDPADEDP